MCPPARARLYRLAGLRYRVDAATNRELYGADATPEQILGWESTAPEAFKPLFDLLTKVGHAAAKGGGLCPAGHDGVLF